MAKRRRSALPSLPEEIIRIILAWLPSITLMEWRRVCKSWSVMIKDAAFIHLHLSRSHHDLHHYLLLQEDNIWTEKLKYSLLTPPMGHRDSSASTWWRDRSLDWALFECGSRRNSWSVLGSLPAAGLVLVEITGNLFLFNPFIGKFKKVPPSPTPTTKFMDDPIYSGRSKPSMFGFGIDPNSGDYKVVEINQHNHTHMYSSSTGSWRRLVDVAPSEPYRAVGNHVSSISLDGVIHWLVTSRETQTTRRMTVYGGTVSPHLMKILSFDIARARFQITELPRHVPIAGATGRVDVSIFAVKDRISLGVIWHGKETRNLDTWEMDYNKAREGRLPWSAKHPFPFPGKVKRVPLGLTLSGEVLVSDDKRMLGIYDPETDVLKKTRRELHWGCCYYSLVDSLFLLN